MLKFFLASVVTTVITVSHASTITVTNTNDSGAGSLRQALTNALDGDIITFDVMGVIVVSAPLDISKNVTIHGPGANLLAIDGNGTTIVFEDLNYSINTVEITGLEIRNGFSGAYGAGFSCLGVTLTIKYCDIHSNTLSNSYGAAISIWSTASSLTIENSAIHDNTCDIYAAGIYVSDGATVAISNSTFYGNSGNAWGQAIFCACSSLSLTNITIAGHSVGLSAVSINDYVEFPDPSSWKSPTVTMFNCIFDNEIDNYDYLHLAETPGVITSLGYNLSNDDTMSEILTGEGDLNNISALLDAEGLKNNGGSTPTVALQCGSPAIDAGLTFLSTDQIGSPRYGERADIGAFESNIAALNTSTSLDGNTIISNATDVSYQWLDCDNSNAIIEGATENSFTPSSAGHYAVQVTSGNCSAISECVAIILVNVIKTDAEQPIRIYPNPVHDRVTIEFETPEAFRNIKLIDSRGQIIHSEKVADAKEVNLKINTAAGIYMLEIIDPSGEKAVVKIVKK